MTAPPEFTGDDERDLATLRDAFPHLQIAQASNRWWASRGLTREDPGNALQAGTASGLYAAIMSSSRRPR
ncbi:hypothetical protein ACQPZ8_37480 [Actinomadura nitritigenes]|uniref:hypothetical protein n=1 Tax=Actinomadura nitritigenes TaxID=134602 RepID=UPI003D89E036